MVKICNLAPAQFKKYIRHKKVIIFGAGRALESCMELYFEDKTVECVVDNNTSLWNKTTKCNGKDIRVVSIDMLISYLSAENKSDYVIFISSPFYAGEIVEQLDQFDELDGLECFLQIFIRNTMESFDSYSFSSGKNKIPKRIHYIWLGGKELPDEYLRNIGTWKKYNPDFEIIRWDENNLCMDDCDYVKEAYECQEWGFASNFLRMKVIYENGGIYLDTDVEVIASFEKLLNDNAFFNMGNADRINTGCGFGAVKGNYLIEKILKTYEEMHFVDCKGTPLKQPGHIVLNRCLKEEGFHIVNQYEKNKSGIVIYPSEVMSPLTIEGMPDSFSERTVSIHKESGSWKSIKEKNEQREIVKLLRRVSK